MKIYNSPEKESKATIIKMLNKFRRTIHEQRTFQQRQKMQQSNKQIMELNNIVTELKIH